MTHNSLEHHLIHLKERHAELDKKIKDGYTHYLADKNLGKMKQEKLIIKRQIEEVKNKLNTLNDQN